MSDHQLVTAEQKIVDMHFHVGLRGNRYTHWGQISDRMRTDPKYNLFLLYAGLKEGQDTDDTMIRTTMRTIRGCRMDHVVCLALDPVYDEHGKRRLDLTDFWVDDAYVLHLRQQIGPKVLFGASVHPFRPDFEERVERAVAEGAVLVKWLPSSQQFSLAHPKVRDALLFLARARNGEPIPLLLHVGVEYAVPTTDMRTRPYDFLSWKFMDRARNFLRRPRWFPPNIPEVRKTLDLGLQAGCDIIMAHCGLPYFAPRGLGWLEHDDFRAVKSYVERSVRGQLGSGRCYADTSACVTPFRQPYFKALKKLPEGRLLFGSDFPTPVFELSADLEEAWRDFKAMLKGDWWRIVVPQDNPVDVNYRELDNAFGDHPMFTNFDRFLL